MVTLFCAVVGVAGSAFPVDIDAGETVGDLKKAIAEDQKYDFAASKLQLFLAKTEGGAWLIDDDDLDKKMLQNEVDTSKMKRLRGSWKLNKSDLFGPDVALGEDVIHVLIVVPKIDSKRRTVAPAVESVAIPSTTALNKPDEYAEECISLTEWAVDAVHEIPLIWRFMSSLGGCTSSGEIFWRLEDKQVVSLLVDGWFRESTSGSINVHANKKASSWDHRAMASRRCCA